MTVRAPHRVGDRRRGTASPEGQDFQRALVKRVLGEGQKLPLAQSMQRDTKTNDHFIGTTSRLTIPNSPASPHRATRKRTRISSLKGVTGCQEYSEYVATLMATQRGRQGGEKCQHVRRNPLSQRPVIHPSSQKSLRVRPLKNRTSGQDLITYEGISLQDPIFQTILRQQGVGVVTFKCAPPGRGVFNHGWPLVTSAEDRPPVQYLINQVQSRISWRWQDGFQGFGTIRVGNDALQAVLGSRTMQKGHLSTCPAGLDDAVALTLTSRGNLAEMCLRFFDNAASLEASIWGCLSTSRRPSEEVDESSISRQGGCQMLPRKRIRLSTDQRVSFCCKQSMAVRGDVRPTIMLCASFPLYETQKGLPSP